MFTPINESQIKSADNQSTLFSQPSYQKDFLEFWQDIKDNYAYLDQQQIDWDKVKTIYEPQSPKITDRNEFIRLLENVLNELYNGHSSPIPSPTCYLPAGLSRPEPICMWRG